MKKKSANSSKSSSLAAGRAVLAAETQALQAATARLDENFSRVVDLIQRASGKVVVVGLGKSGHVAHSVAATLCSLGTPAVYLHASEAAHGDIGIVGRGDVVILISKSGATPELVRLAPALRATGAKLVALVGNLRSPLAGEADAVLDASVAREADPLGLAPTWLLRKRRNFPWRILPERIPPGNWAAMLLYAWPMSCMGWTK